MDGGIIDYAAKLLAAREPAIVGTGNFVDATAFTKDARQGVSHWQQLHWRMFDFVYKPLAACYRAVTRDDDERCKQAPCVPVVILVQASLEFVKR